MEKTKVLNRKRKKMIDQLNDRSFKGIFRKGNTIYCPFWKNSRVLLEYLKKIPPASSGDLTIKFY